MHGSAAVIRLPHWNPSTTPQTVHHETAHSTSHGNYHSSNIIIPSVGFSHGRYSFENLFVDEPELRAIDCSVVAKIRRFLDQLFTLVNNITNLE